MDAEDPYEYMPVFPAAGGDDDDWCHAEFAVDTRTDEAFLECKHCEGRAPGVDLLALEYRFADVMAEGAPRADRIASSPLRLAVGLRLMGRIMRFLFVTHRACIKPYRAVSGT